MSFCLSACLHSLNCSPKSSLISRRCQTPSHSAAFLFSLLAFAIHSSFTHPNVLPVEMGQGLCWIQELFVGQQLAAFLTIISLRVVVVVFILFEFKVDPFCGMMHACICMYICMWRPETNTRCLSPATLYLLFIELDFSHEPRA